jgi:hypothetical protein
MTSSPDSEQSDHETSLAALLASMQVECSELREITLQVQEALSPELGGRAAEPGQIQKIQRLDEIFQRLEGLSLFLNGLAGLTPPAWRLAADAAIDPIRLSRLAARLRGQEMSETGEIAGEVEFF